jgi:hypothetical protein
MQPRDSLSATAHSCSGASECAADSVGHGLNFLQRRAASSASSKWRDAIVTSIDSTGWITIGIIDDDTTTRLWHHADEEIASLRAGEPVALHGVYDVLAHGSAWFSVLVQR